MTRRSIIALVFVLLPVAAFSQPNLNFKRITSNWPTIKLYFSVGCNGNPAYNMTEQDFKIFENGVEVKDFTLWCPDPTKRCAISVALVFDASGSMSGSGNAGAKLAGRAFIDLMDGVIDEATVMWFNTMVNKHQPMTTIKPLLYAAVDALPASGGTAVWDGCYAGIVELIGNGVNRCQAVILMTDGGDNASSRTPAEIISLANRNYIRVFTIGLGSSINATELEMISLLTGGRYYQTPNAGQLAAIYQEISTIIFQGFQECEITYERSCMDGAMRTVELQLVNYCGGTDIKTKTYRAPLDSTTFTDLSMKLGERSGKGDSDVRIPLDLMKPLNNKMFYPLAFTLLFDPSCVQFKSIATPPGSLLETVPITVTPIAGGVRIETRDRKLVNGMGQLMEFTFHTSDPGDTVCCNIMAVDAQFEQGCYIPIINEGEICINERQPEVACAIDAPQELVWQRTLKDYLPNPFPVTARYFNTGDKEAKNARYRITYDAKDIQLVWPHSDVQNGVPPGIGPGGYSEVTWQLAAKRRTSGDSTHICITAMFDNHEEVECCVAVFIPPTGPILECMVDVPEIVADNQNRQYNPMPFPVTVTVTNEGGMQSDSVFATIIVPPDLSLASADAPDNNTKHVLPSLLLPQQSGTIQWMVKHPTVTQQKQYVIQMWVKTANADSSLCEAMVTIPALDAPILECIVEVPKITADNTNWRYDPMPFPVTVMVSNKGGVRTESVSATIIVPPSLSLAGADAPDNNTKLLTPETLSTQQSGLVQWMVKHPPTTTEKQYVVQAWVKTANADSTLCESVVTIPALQNSLTVSITPEGPTTFCDGEEVVLDAGGGYASYAWSSGELTRKISVSKSGYYWVRVENATGQHAVSDSILVTVLPTPPKPTITRNGDVLLADNAITWQWLKDGTIIAGETNQFHVLTDAGVYTVRVTNAEGCENVSDPFFVTVLDIEEIVPSSFTVDVFPEPSHGDLFVQITSATNDVADIYVYTLLGKERYAITSLRVNGNLIHGINTRGWTKGVYFVRVKNGERSVTQAVNIR